LPVSSTSAGGRSNAISRVLKPSFATPMKGVTRMPYPHDEPPWTPQRTRALFRLFQTSAPPDFQHQVLERVAQRQHTHRRRCMGWRPLLAWWPGARAWGVGTPQPHRRWPGHVITMIGCCGLVLGTSLTWWAMWTGPAVPPTPELLVSRLVSPPRTSSVPTETHIRGDHHGGFGRAEPPEPAVHAAEPPEPGAGAPQIHPGQSVDESTAAQAGDAPERARLMPAPAQHLTAQKERQPPARRHTQRAGRPRSEPGKPARAHTRPGTSQQAPG
jgi:hypothetical protein